MSETLPIKEVVKKKASTPSESRIVKRARIISKEKIIAAVNLLPLSEKVDILNALRSGISADREVIKKQLSLIDQHLPSENQPHHD